MTKTDSDFDSVRLMRSLRDALSQELQELTFEQQRRLMQERLAKATRASSGRTPPTLPDPHPPARFPS